jgi:hypothetical protein
VLVPLAFGRPQDISPISRNLTEAAMVRIRTHQPLEAAMKFMIFVKSNPSLEKTIDDISDTAMKQSMAAMGVFNEELKKAGVLKDCDGLRPSREGKRVRFDGEQRKVVDGPFDGDLVAGYWIWELPSIEDAVAWVKRCPNPMPVPSEIEIRPI